jgi:hypothetical protein
MNSDTGSRTRGPWVKTRNVNRLHHIGFSYAKFRLFNRSFINKAMAPKLGLFRIEDISTAIVSRHTTAS